jgi:hypothetical protein
MVPLINDSLEHSDTLARIGEIRALSRLPESLAGDEWGQGQKHQEIPPRQKAQFPIGQCDGL